MVLILFASSSTSSSVKYLSHPWSESSHPAMNIDIFIVRVCVSVATTETLHTRVLKGNRAIAGNETEHPCSFWLAQSLQGSGELAKIT